jgi:hypothetical protein
MSTERMLNEKITNTRQVSMSLGLVSMFLLSMLAGLGVLVADLGNQDTTSLNERAKSPLSSDAQVIEQGGQGSWDDGQGSYYGPDGHPALYNVQYPDSMVAYGKVEDHSLLDLRSQNYGVYLEETSGKDHDNDGIQDLDDLDDDNDGIYDLLERFDG